MQIHRRMLLKKKKISHTISPPGPIQVIVQTCSTEYNSYNYLPLHPQMLRQNPAVAVVAGPSVVAAAVSIDAF